MGLVNFCPDFFVNGWLDSVLGIIIWSKEGGLVVVLGRDRKSRSECVGASKGGEMTFGNGAVEFMEGLKRAKV